MQGWGAVVKVDSLGWPLLTVEESEFLEYRGYRVEMSLSGAQVACRGGRHSFMYSARLVLDCVLTQWGGDTVWRRSRNPVRCEYYDLGVR